MFKCLTCSAFGAGTNIRVLPVLTGASILAGLAQTLVDVCFAQAASVAGSAVAGERGQAVLTGAIVTGVGVALIDVSFAVLPRVTWTIMDILI